MTSLITEQKKSQMEILGLAVVVVLILVATIFVVRFLVVKAPAEHRKGFVSAELASNMLNTFLKTSAPDCSQLTMTELLQDCAQGETITCSNNEKEKSCKFVESTATTIFDETFKKWNIKYEFLVCRDINCKDTPHLSKIGEACGAEKKSKLYPIPSTPPIYAKLDICG